MKKKIIAGISLIVMSSLIGCSSTGPSTNNTFKAYYYLAKENGLGGQVYYLTKTSDGWKASKRGSVSDDNVERVSIDLASRTIYLAVDSDGRKEGFCYLSITETRKKDGYLLCNSAFMSVSGAQAGFNILTSPFTAVLSAVTTTRSFQATLFNLDREKLIEAAQSSGLITLAEQDRQAKLAAAAKEEQDAEDARKKVEQERLAEDAKAEQGDAKAKYQRGLSYLSCPDCYSYAAEEWFVKAAAAGSADAAYKLGMYQKLNHKNEAEAERLWTKAAQGGNLAAKKELNELASARARLAQEQAKEERLAKERAAREAKEKERVASFRKKIREGDETNCGPVIEVKAKTIKVSFAVANYGNEHWIRRDEIFPAGYGCRFFNGEYQMPY